MAGALTPAQERESLGEFALANALLQSQFALTVESDLPTGAVFDSLGTSGPGIGQGTSVNDIVEMQSEWFKGSKVEARPGVINHLPPGSHLKLNKVENPNSSFNDYDKSLTRKAARAAGLSYEDVSGDYSQTNFSASRMAGEQPHRANMKRRRAIAERFYRAIFHAWLEEAVETGVVDLPAGAPPFWQATHAYTESRWLGFGRAEPDRKKAADATILELENGLLTFEDALAERGLDLETHIENLKQERALLEAAGLTHPFYPGATTTQVRDTEQLPNNQTPAGQPVRKGR